MLFLSYYFICYVILELLYLLFDVVGQTVFPVPNYIIVFLFSPFTVLNKMF